VALVAGCATAPPANTLGAPSSATAVATIAETAAPTATGASAPSSASPAGTPPVPLVELPDPDTPFIAADVLDAMRASRRPGGVPDQLETAAIGGAIADRLWTLSGEPWPEMTVAGSCGSHTCTVEVGGVPHGAPGEDLYVFSVDPATASVTPVESTLRGVPAELLPELDAATRELWDGDLDGLALSSVRWLAPPDGPAVVLAYRSGGEEGAPAVDLLLDLATGTIEPVR
jgi:hypothetical protein